MIYCNIKGGLGNVLFQLAAGISLAIEKKTEFSVSNYEWHINYLNTERERNPILNHANEYNFYFKNINKIKQPKNTKKVEYPFSYIQHTELTDNCVIDGYFQSEKYFIKYRKTILKQFKLPFFKRIKTYLKYPYFIKNNFTSIHVRRGEYLTSSIHFNQNMSYYEEAIKKLNENTKKFVVFSDDIEWCKKNFIGDKYIFIENEKDYIEIFLMSKCKNNVICNSSFSWWGAWLNENKKRNIIAPKKWFKTNELNTVDLIPENWILM